MKKSRVFVIAGALVAFSIIAYFVIAKETLAFDETVRSFFYSLRNDPLTVVMTGITYLGNWQAILIVCAALLIYKKTRIQVGIPVAMAAITSQIAKVVIKASVERPRPPLADRLIEQGGFSFPSGHAITSMAVYGFLIYFVRVKIKDKRRANILTVLLTIPAVFVGLSRIYLGVHYPTDVLAGWFLAVAIITAGILAIEKRDKIRRK